MSDHLPDASKMTGDLLSRLRAATEGSRELSDEVIQVFGWTKYHENGWRNPEGENYWFGSRPDPTCDLQDASELVPEGWRVGRLSWEPGLASIILENMGVYAAALPANPIIHVTGIRPPALALCIAALMARQAHSAEPRKGSEE